jgi:hypothetical protein
MFDTLISRTAQYRLVLAPALLPSITNTDSKTSNDTNNDETFAHAIGA